jgi:adenine-specific DNA-methyltransferase
VIKNKEKKQRSRKIDLTEGPSSYADRLGVKYAAAVTGEHKRTLGQFFTPVDIAQFMSSFQDIKKKRIKILDPGCGIGILSAALAEELVKIKQVKVIELVAFETDVNLLPIAENCYTYLSHWLKEKGIDFTFFLCKNDFILHNSHVLADQHEVQESYDIIISNPPYFKLPKNDERAIAAKSVIYGQSNIYSIFMLIAAKLLGENGQLIFITPRSFCSGNYFRLFREIFFSKVDIKTIHLFNSRKESFKRDKVLQENIIIVANKKSQHKKEENIVLISSSSGMEDIQNRNVKQHEWKNLVNLNSLQKILHLPLTETDERIIRIFKSWTGSLKSYDIEISTGPVVDFRSAELIEIRKTNKTVPLMWLHNVEPMRVTWPKEKGYNGKKKGQYIIKNEDSVKRLVPNRNYVLLRRFSSKEDNQRLVAAPYFKKMNPEVSALGVENHLNYIYHKTEELKDHETIGIAALLNSRLFDLYFRTFNGNINVSATELRDFPLPSFSLISILGRKMENRDFKSLNIDALVSEVFDVHTNLFDNYEQ